MNAPDTTYCTLIVLRPVGSRRQDLILPDVPLVALDGRRHALGTFWDAVAAHHRDASSIQLRAKGNGRLIRQWVPGMAIHPGPTDVQLLNSHRRDMAALSDPAAEMRGEAA